MYIFGTSKVTRFDVGIGNRSVGFRVTVPHTLKKLDPDVLDPDVYVDVLLFVRGRAGLELEADSDSEPFDRATEIRLARLMYDRIGDRAG